MPVSRELSGATAKPSKIGKHMTNPESPTPQISEEVSVKVVSDLLARLEAAEGPDRELDVELGLALGMPDEWRQRYTDEGATVLAFVAGHPAKVNCADYHRFPPVTACLYAALALVERVLPGRLPELEKLRSGNWYGSVNQADPAHPKPFHDASAKTPALALLAAMLKALSANGAMCADRPPQIPGETKITNPNTRANDRTREGEHG